MNLITDLESDQSALYSSSADLKQIYSPVEADLKDFETELFQKVKASIDRNQIETGIIDYFFEKSGKYLRPLLVFLSAKAGSARAVGKEDHDKLVTLAVVVELIHNASLVHDDVLDDSVIRRSRESLNKKFGNHVAVLAGDILYSLAFSSVIEIKNFEIMKKLCDITEQMCVGEIYNLRNFVMGAPDTGKFENIREMYLKIIEKKTALFMSVCCECGAVLSGAGGKLSRALSVYGYNLGMIYQFVDDYIDHDFVWDRHEDTFSSLVKKHSAALEASLEAVRESPYKQGLRDLHAYILNRVEKK